MHSREQYLERVRDEYRNADKKTKTRLLNEARRRTRLNRKVLIGKLAHPAAIRQKKNVSWKFGSTPESWKLAGTGLKAWANMPSPASPSPWQ